MGLGFVIRNGLTFFRCDIANTPQLSVSLFDSYSLRSKKSSKRDPHICGLDTLFESGVVKEFISVVYGKVVFVSNRYPTTMPPIFNSSLRLIFYNMYRDQSVKSFEKMIIEI
jgi:hypothetical protein